MTALDRIVVVGGSVAGLSVVETLRSEGFQGKLTLVADEPHLPYDRPPLSKQVLSGRWSADQTALRQTKDYDALDLDFRLGQRARRLDRRNRVVTLNSGCSLPFDALVVSTGVRPRRLPFGNDLQGVHVLRTLEDCANLRAELLQSKKVVIIGAGFLGTEVAATACELGCDVLIVDPLSRPVATHLTALIGDRISELHREHGVRLQFNSSVVKIESVRGRASQVFLSTGEVCATDVILVAIGSSPAVAWLADSGLALDDGVVCDEYCRADPNIYAAGDVASWYHCALGTRMRIEHRMNAVEQGAAVARNLLGRQESFQPIPFFWSDQYKSKLQAYGIFPNDAEVSIASGDPQGRFVAVYRRRGRLLGAVGWNAFKELQAFQNLLAESLVEGSKELTSSVPPDTLTASSQC